VFTTVTDPVADGFVASLNRPGGNVTGLTLISVELIPKVFELLHEAIPTVRKIALLANRNNPATTNEALDAARKAALVLGLETIVLDAGNEYQIEKAFEAAVQQRADAVSISSDAYLTSRNAQIVGLSLRYALPVVGGGRESVVAGMLMSYGARLTGRYRQAGVYVGRILKGEKPADLPVMQPTKFELIVNLKTAKAIGLTIPETFLVRADEVIE
jgi:ABC-type uncharacterized transport system substrate-binding protein